MNEVQYAAESAQQAPSKSKKGQRSVLVLVLGVVIAVGLAWGGLTMARQIRTERSREFLLQAIQQHLQEQRPVLEALGTLESVAVNDSATSQSAASGLVVFDVVGSRGQAQLLGTQQPNGLAFEMKLSSGQTVEVTPLVSR